MHELNELVVFKRGGKPVLDIDGVKFYSSEKLTKNIVQAFGKSSRTKPVARKLEDMIAKGDILPLFSTKNLIHFLYRKIFNPTEYEFITGFWAPPLRKILIFVDSETNLLGYASNNMLSRTMIHELMHKAAHEKPSSFKNIFKNELRIFYGSYWMRLLQLEESKINDKDIEALIKFLRVTFDNLKSRITVNSALAKYYNLLDSYFSPITKLEKDKFEYILKGYIVSLKIYFKDSMAFRRSYYSPLFRLIYGPLISTYRDVFGVSTGNILVVQELLFPSEVIAVLAETKTPTKIYTAIKQL